MLLLRGINVGGAGKLPMKDLKAHLARLGAVEPQTYIQSGNAVFEGDLDPADVAQALTAAITKDHGFTPHALVLPAQEVEEALAAYPFPEGHDHPKFANIWFCDRAPATPDLATLEGLAGETERFALDRRWFFLDAPDGIGRSKLAARVEKALGVPATARNLNTVKKLVAMARER